MFVNVGRLLAALVLACTGLVLSQGAAQACTCESLTTQAATKAATSVFTGTVTDSSTAAKPDGQRGTITTYDVAVERVYKGQVRTATLTVTSSKDHLGCGPARVRDDEPYVFFTRTSGEELRVTRCGGTAPATDKLVGKVEKLLGGGRPPVPDEPEQAVFTPVSDAEPTPFTRLAAPGLALVLAGLLGLGLARRLGRHH